MSKRRTVRRWTWLLIGIPAGAILIAVIVFGVIPPTSSGDLDFSSGRMINTDSPEKSNLVKAIIGSGFQPQAVDRHAESGFQGYP